MMSNRTGDRSGANSSSKTQRNEQSINTKTYFTYKKEMISHAHLLLNKNPLRCILEQVNILSFTFVIKIYAIYIHSLLNSDKIKLN